MPSSRVYYDYAQGLSLSTPPIPQSSATMPEVNLYVHLDSRKWPSESSNTKIQLIGTFTVAVFYGLVVSLVCHTLQPLIFHSKQRTYSNRMRWFLIVYTISMFMLSTAAFVQTAAFVMHFAFDGAFMSPHNFVESNTPLFLPLTVWGADSMMVRPRSMSPSINTHSHYYIQIWRCIILYGNASRGRRVIINCTLAIMSLISIGELARTHASGKYLTFTTGSGVLYYILPTMTPFYSNSPLFAIMITISVTTFVNVVLTSLIAYRLLRHQNAMRRVMGAQYGSPYMRLIAILVESCAFIVFTGIVYLVLFAVDREHGTIIPMLILPQVCVISPIMIVYAVGKGKAIHKAARRAGDDGDNTGDHLAISRRQRRASVISQSIAFRDPELGPDQLHEDDSESSGTGMQEGDEVVKTAV